jgi:hypothetical protein
VIDERGAVVSGDDVEDPSTRYRNARRLSHKSTAATGPAFRGNKSLSVLVQKG